MDIGIVSSFIDEMSGGIGVYTYNLIRNIVEIDKNNDYHLIHYKKNNMQLYKDNNECIIPKHSLMDNMYGSYSFWRYYTMPRKLKNMDVDVVHDPYELGPLSFKMPFKKIITIHDLTPLLFPKLFKWGDVMLHKLLFKKTIKDIDKIITVSEHSKTDIINHFKVPEDKIKVIYNGKDPAFKKMNQEEFQDVLMKYSIDYKFILTVGGIHPIKNIPNLLKAFYKLKKSGLKHKLVVVGEKVDSWENIFEIVKNLNLQNEVLFTGAVPFPDLVKLYNAADLFAYPCLYAGFGLPPLEAMTCGTPVITSNNSSLPEVVGDAAIMIDPLNVNELAGAIETLLNDDDTRKELEKKGLKRAELFDWKKTAQETLKVYEKV